jgi:DNA polymerase-3 subunit beta
MTIELQTRALKAAVLAVPKKDVREYLTGACVEITANHAIIVGTNGHWLFAARSEHGEEIQEPVTIIIPRADVEQAVKGHKGDTISLGRLSNGEWRLGSNIFKPIDGTYPDWRRVVPKKISGQSSDYSPVYLAQVHKALSLWNHIPVSNPWGGFTLYQNGLEGAAAQGADTEAFCVLMPMRRAKEAPASPTVGWALPPSK